MISTLRVSVANEFAAEHLQVVVTKLELDDVLNGLVNAGEILVGQHTPFSAGNFVIGCPASLPDERIRPRVLGDYHRHVPQANRRRSCRCPSSCSDGPLGDRSR